MLRCCRQLADNTAAVVDSRTGCLCRHTVYSCCHHRRRYCRRIKTSPFTFIQVTYNSASLNNFHMCYYFQGCRGYLYPYVDIRLRLNYGYNLGYFFFCKSFKLNCHATGVISIITACTGRLFIEAGELLTKQRKRMSPEIMKKLVYIRYEKKYRK